MSKKIVVFPGCYALVKQLVAEVSTLKVLQYFNIEPLVPRNINCCGFPVRGVYPFVSFYLTSRLLASLYNEESEGVLTLCNGCYLMLREVVYKLRENRKLLEAVKSYLEKEGLDFKAIPRIIHPVELFHDLIGIDKLRSIASEKLYNGVLVATHYGCHALRPSTTPSFDNPVNPSKMERVIEVLGFKTKNYPEKPDCCGANLIAVNRNLALKLAYNKISSVIKWGFNLLVTTCPYCFEMLDTQQEPVMQMFNETPKLPVMLLSQLIGLRLGLSERDVGLNFNLSPIDLILPIIVKR